MNEIVEPTEVDRSELIGTEMSQSEHIKDLTRRRKRFQVSVRSSALFDVMLATWSAFGGDDKAGAHELGKRWFDRFRTAIPEDVVAEMEDLGVVQGTIWTGVLAYVASAGPDGTDDLLEWLAADDGSLARSVMMEFGWSADEEDLEAILFGDAAARDRVLEGCKPTDREALRRMLEADRFGPRLAAVLRSLHARYLEEGPTWQAAIESSAASTLRLADVLAPRPLIEQITNGLDYEIPLGMTRLIAVPTVTLRPWTLVTQFDDAVIVSYPVADDHLEADPDAPPGWLVRFHKALGDARRLRILRRLADGRAGLTELTELVGLAKSTVFHHIGVLRAAGLVRVTVDQDSEGGTTYELRRPALEEAGIQLEKYLHSDPILKEPT
jgi:DNA-binding transcriptional ArsR family regulator